ncbi:MAG: YdeI/OmpD-associated family protein, partial [Candidatus Microthrix sp.]|nr:YdeI/OmpD-associated family protein [Candidatus Microthrix sp.]
QGPNSRSALRICFRSIDDANRLADTVKAYVEEAIDVEEAGLQVAPAPVLPPPEELQNRLETDPAFKAAFEALTPGRQREYNLYFSDAKQSKTRNARVDKYAPKILAGKGFRDR